MNRSVAPAAGYGLAVLASGIAGALTWAVGPLLGGTFFFEFFHMAVVVAAFFGGLGPGMLAAAISFFVLDYFFLPPVNQFVLGPHLFRLAAFGAAAALTSLLSEKLKKAKREAVEKTVLEVSAREQRRLGQDLHDGLCQTLAGVRLMVEDVRRTPPDAPGREETLEKAEARLTEALNQAYTISRGLVPVELEANGLMSALGELAANVSKARAVRCRFLCPRPVAVGDNAVATHLYRIAQEAVANGIKNGKAGRLNLRLSDRGPHIQLRVADNGSGLHNGPLREGMGMKIMEHRAHMIGARLTFRSRPRGGTFVACVLPKARASRNGHGG